MAASCSIPDPKSDHPAVIALPPYLAFGHLAAGAALGLALGIDVSCPLALRGLGALPIVIGALLIAAAIRTMRAAKTNVSPFQATHAIVRSGPFRFTRNPIYLGFLFIYFGLGVAAGSIGVGILALLPSLALMLHFGVVTREERYLAAKFPTDYPDYLRSVRRWI